MSSDGSPLDPKKQCRHRTHPRCLQDFEQTRMFLIKNCIHLIDSRASAPPRATGKSHFGANIGLMKRFSSILNVFLSFCLSLTRSRSDHFSASDTIRCASGDAFGISALNVHNAFSEGLSSRNSMIYRELGMQIRLRQTTCDRPLNLRH